MKRIFKTSKSWKILNWKGLVLLFTILFLLAFVVFQPALAKGVIFQGDVPAGTVVENDLFLVGESPSIDGTVHGDVYVIGNYISINGEIDGSLFLLSQTAQIANKVQGTGYAASLEMTLAPEASFQRNLYFAGLSLIMQPGSTIGRDLVALSIGAQLNGSVRRSVQALIGPLEILNAVLELMDAPPIRLRELGQGSLTAPSLVSRELTAWRLGGATSLIGSPVLARLAREVSPTAPLAPPAQQAGEIDWTQVGAWALDRLRELAILFLFGLLAAWLFPSWLTGSAQSLRRKPLPALGFGLLGLVLAVNVFLVAFLVAALFLVFGLWLGTLDLWAITFALWVVIYPALSLATALFWLFLTYGTKVLVAYFAGAWLLEKLVRKPAHRVLAILLGLLIYVLLAAIPMIGWVIAVLVTIFGLGAVWLEYRYRATQEKSTAAQPDEGPLELISE